MSCLASIGSLIWCVCPACSVAIMEGTEQSVFLVKTQRVAVVDLNVLKSFARAGGEVPRAALQVVAGIWLSLGSVCLPTSAACLWSAMYQFAMAFTSCVPQSPLLLCIGRLLGLVGEHCVETGV